MALKLWGPGYWFWMVHILYYGWFRDISLKEERGFIPSMALLFLWLVVLLDILRIYLGVVLGFWLGQRFPLPYWLYFSFPLIFIWTGFIALRYKHKGEALCHQIYPELSLEQKEFIGWMVALSLGLSAFVWGVSIVLFGAKIS